MNTLVTVLGTVVVLGVLLAARYGADSRRGDDPTGRDPAWPAGPTREHTPREDLARIAALIAAWSRRVAAHRRCWELLDAAQRPWETTVRRRPSDPGRRRAVRS